MGQPGRVLAVAQRSLSASVALDALSADATLTVDDDSVFAPEGGTAVVTLDDSTLAVTYTGVADDVVTLSAPLGVAVSASSPVTPVSSTTLRVATVTLSGDADDAPVQAVIDPLAAAHVMLALGVLDEPVSVWVEDGGVAGYGYTVTRMIGYEPSLDGAALAPGSITETKISDDAITTPKLAANAVVAAKIAANAVVAGKIAAGAVTAVKIAADAIDGKTITGATVRTAATGTRVVNDNDGVTLFSVDWQQVLAWPTSTPLSDPGSAFAARGGDVYFFDHIAHKIVIYNGATGEPSSSFTATGAPLQIAFDSTGAIWGADAANTMVRKYTDPAGEVFSFSPTDPPNHIAVDSADNVYVTTTGGGGNLVRKFSSSGSVITSWAIGGTPWGLAIDSSDNVYVVDGDNNLVRKFSSTGSVITTWATSSTAYELDVSTDGVVFVAGGGFLHEYSNTGTTISTKAIQFTTNVATEGTDYVYVMDGAVIRKFARDDVEHVSAALDVSTGELSAATVFVGGRMRANEAYIGALSAASFDLSPVVSTGTFSITFPASTSTDGTATVSFATALPGTPQILNIIPTDPTNGNIALNCYETARSASGFTYKGRRGGAATINFKYTAVYFPTA